MAIRYEQELTLIFAEFWNVAFSSTSGHQCPPTSKDKFIYQEYIKRKCLQLDAYYLGPACDILKIGGTATDPQNQTARHVKFLTRFATSMGTPAYSVVLDTFVDHLHHQTGASPLNDAERDLIRRACFASFGLLSLFWHADPVNTDLKQLIMLIPIAKSSSNRTFIVNKLDSCFRPLRFYLRTLSAYLPHITFTNAHFPIPDTQSTEDTPSLSPEIRASSISYWALSKIARISVEWTDNMLMHLMFDRTRRCLFIFCLPTFCVLSCNMVTETLYDRVLSERYTDSDPRDNKMPSCLTDKELKREILLSYRVIFGQHLGSRLLFRHKFARSKVLDQDPLLKTLCAKPLEKVNQCLHGHVWPESCRDCFDVDNEVLAQDSLFQKLCAAPLKALNQHIRGHVGPESSKYCISADKGSLQELDVYDVATDFPLLGDRLVKLQQFSLRQSPSKFKDVWRDFRNPLQWYTFWAVIIFGLASIALSFLQLLFSIAQLAVGVKQLALTSS